jgi:hypothetical protein
MMFMVAGIASTQAGRVVGPTAVVLFTVARCPGSGLFTARQKICLSSRLWLRVSPQMDLVRERVGT